MTQVLKTKDYAIFKKHENNREMDEGNLRRIVFSIQTNNLLQFRPILVDKNMFVLDGQHRLEAAKSLGVDIYYSIKDHGTHQDIVLLNTNQKQWILSDYVDYYISLGNLEYKKFKDFCTKWELGTAQLVKYIGGHKTRGTLIKSGKMVFFTPEKVNEMEDFLGKNKRVRETLENVVIGSKTFLTSERLRFALWSFLGDPEVSVDVLIEKLQVKAAAIHKCSDKLGYFLMIREIYNWRNPNPVSIYSI